MLACLLEIPLEEKHCVPQNTPSVPMGTVLDMTQKWWDFVTCSLPLYQNEFVNSLNLRPMWVFPTVLRASKCY